MSETTSLKRTVGANFLLLFVLGDVLGAGIYSLIGEVSGRVGGAAWIPPTVAFGFAVVTAFSYAELVRRCPRAGVRPCSPSAPTDACCSPSWSGSACSPRGSPRPHRWPGLRRR